MKIMIRRDITQEEAAGVFIYLLRKNFMLHGRAAIGRTAGEIGKYLLHPQNRDYIKDIRFDNERYYVKLASDHPALALVHHIIPEGVEVTNEEFYPITYSLKEDELYIKVQDSTWKTLQAVVVFTETECNVFANDKASLELDEFTKVDLDYVNGLLKDDLYDVLLRLEKQVGYESMLNSGHTKAEILQWIIDTLNLEGTNE